MTDMMFQKMYDTLHACLVKQKAVLDEIPLTAKNRTEEAYYQMFNVATDMIRDLQGAQLQTEAIYMDGPNKVGVSDKIRSLTKMEPLSKMQAASVIPPEEEDEK